MFILRACMRVCMRADVRDFPVYVSVRARDVARALRSEAFMSQKRCQSVCVWVGGWVHMRKCKCVCVCVCEPLRMCVRVFTVLIFRLPDQGSGQWRSEAPMPSKRRALTACVMDCRVYAIGGYDGSSWLNTAESFDPRTGVSQRFPAQILSA